MEIINDFLRRWTEDNVKNMTLDEYMNVGNKDTFCYWVETKTRILGSIQGSTAIKFGIYERKNNDSAKKDKRYIHDDKHTWLSGYGENKETAFNNLKEDILKIINCSKNGDLTEIDKINLSPMFKWKIAYLYNNERLIPIFSREVLEKIANHCDIETNNKTPISEFQKLIMSKKPNNLNEHEFMKQLYDKYAKKKTEADIDEETETLARNKIRKGQHKFKNKLLKKYKKCLLCDIDKRELLIGSHIKPWKKSNNKERLDVHNGLLLCPLHDKLFDLGFISFGLDGNIIISKRIKEGMYNDYKLNITKIKINKEMEKYIIWHKNNIYK